MRKSILISMLLISNSYGQMTGKILLVDADFSFYIGQVSIARPHWSTTKIAFVQSFGDTIWFEQSSKLRRFAFNPAELIPESSPKPRFAVGDSVSFMPDPSFSYYWLNAKVLDYSTNQRYLLAFQLENLEGRKTKTQRWVDSYLVESYANVKKK